MVEADKICNRACDIIFTHTASLRDFGRKGGILLIMGTCQIRIICCNLRNVICANYYDFSWQRRLCPVTHAGHNLALITQQAKTITIYSAKGNFLGINIASKPPMAIKMIRRDIQ